MLVDEDECWFSRFAQPRLNAWGERSLHLMQRLPRRGEKRKALACFGALRQDTGQVYLQAVATRPNSEQQWVFLMGLLAVARDEGKRVLVVIWDNAAWHTSRRIRQWIRDYNQAAKRLGEPRLLVHGLPTRSPWLNPIEPCWLHAKRCVCQPVHPLTPEELTRRLYAYCL